MLADLRDRVAVVTGAASGIGLALVEELLASGARVVAVDVEEDRLSREVRRLRHAGGAVSEAVVDVSDAAAMLGLAEATLADHGSVELLCNNAGVSASGPIWAIEPATWRWVLGVNLGGVLNGIRAFVPAMVERDHGHVVNTASFAGLVTGPHLGPYVTGKHAVVAASEVLHQDLRRAGSSVDVSVACPGGVTTDLPRSSRNRPGWARSGYANEDPSLPVADPAAAAVAATAAGFIPPVDVARQMLDAVRTGRFWVLTHPERSWAVTRRASLTVAGEPPDPDYPTATGDVGPEGAPT